MKANISHYYPDFGIHSPEAANIFQLPTNRKELMKTFGSVAVKENALNFFSAQHWGAMKEQYKKSVVSIPYSEILGETLAQIRRRAVIYDTRIIKHKETQNDIRFDTTEEFYLHISKLYFAKLNNDEISLETPEDIKEYYRHCAGSYKAGRTYLNKHLPEQIQTIDEVKAALQHIAAAFFYFANVETDDDSFQRIPFKKGFSTQEALEYIDAVRQCFLSNFSVYHTPTDELTKMLKVCKETQCTDAVKEYLGICDVLGYNKHDDLKEKSHITIAVSFYAYNRLDVFIKIRTALQQAEEILHQTANISNASNKTPSNSKVRSKIAK